MTFLIIGCAVAALYLLMLLWTGWKGYYFPVHYKKTESNIKKVACVGDSITYGYAIENWYFHHYPYMLQTLLGRDCYVRNFGLSGSTGMRSAKMSYRKRALYRRSRRFLPDIVIVMFGTNDSNTQNWQGKDKFYSEYWELLCAYRELESHPAVYVMTPPPLFQPLKTEDARMDANLAIAREAIRELADDLDITLIDLFAQTEHHADWFQPDGLHPNAKGAMEIAHIVYENVKGTVL